MYLLIAFNIKQSVLLKKNGPALLGAASSPSPCPVQNSCAADPKSASFFNFYIIFFPIFQKYMPNHFFCKNVILPPVHPAEGRYRRMNRRYGTVATSSGTVATYRQINRRYCSNHCSTFSKNYNTFIWIRMVIKFIRKL